jgi:hypothetical protein
MLCIFCVQGHCILSFDVVHYYEKHPIRYNALLAWAGVNTRAECTCIHLVFTWNTELSGYNHIYKNIIRSIQPCK